MRKKSRRIFIEQELYNFCLAEVCSISVEDESDYRSDWGDFVEKDLEIKYGELSDAGQNAFDKKLRKVAIKFKEDFDNLPEKMESKEDYVNVQEEKDSLMYKVAEELSEFWVK